MDAWRQKTSVVSKLRINGGGSDALATRLHFERLFGADDFLPTSLPATAIVCIKHLRDPAPRSLRLNRFDAARTNAWRNSVAREIEMLYGRAFRPIREAVPAQAESVVFADKTELLACLASDWCDQFLSERWWWRGLFPDLQPAHAVAKAWLDAAEFAPAALQLLARQKKAAKFAARLQPHEAAELLRRIVRVFNLDKLQAALFEPLEKETPETLPNEKPSAEQFRQAKNYFAAALSSAPLGSDAETETLSFERQALLAVSLTLARSPSVARSTEFSRELKIFRAGFETRKIYRGKISKQTPTPRQQKKKSAFLREETIAAKPPVEMREFFEDFSGEQKKSSTAVVSPEKPKRKSPKKARSDSEKIIFEAEPEKQFETPPRKKTSGPRSEIKFERPKHEKEFEHPQSKSKLKPRKKETKPDRFEKAIETFAEIGEETGIVVETNYGGVFYLLNLALYLKLYRDFTEAPEPEIDLNIWDFVALLGRDFVGRRIEKDPIWKLLADLAGRENEKRKRRPAENWLKDLFEDTRARLFRALNCRTREEINALLLERKATVSVTATHLEVAFNLADIAFEVRLSGLDSDPGWIPAAGKFVYFHFV